MIEAPLRAFFMLYSSDRKWSVTVCRDLGAVMRAWKMRKEPDRDVAVLHVGFDRPPSHSFNEIAEAHAGRMLLTTAAKHSLPNSFIVSAAPIGATERTEVFVGLQGWGYILTDPTIGTDEVDPLRSDALNREPQGWVASFLSENPMDSESLAAQGVFDDVSYLDREAGLKRSVRHRTGVYRAHFITGVNCDDPCKIARAVPPWLAEREITSLNLTVRANNVFRTSGIKTVRDLSDWSPVTLLSSCP